MNGLEGCLSAFSGINFILIVILLNKLIKSNDN
jgi:hypothetical protein